MFNWETYSTLSNALEMGVVAILDLCLLVCALSVPPRCRSLCTNIEMASVSKGVSEIVLSQKKHHLLQVWQKTICNMHIWSAVTQAVQRKHIAW